MLNRMNPKDMKRTRPVENPYEVWRAGSWEWRVLKKYTIKEDEYARAFCAVSSPHTYGSHDLGDVYIRDYESVATLVRVNP